MPQLLLTDRFVESVRVGRRTNYFDKKAMGLCLRVTASSAVSRGTKSWTFVYRLPGRQSQWLRLGSYPALTLSTARTEALRYRALVEVEKRDPVSEAKAQKALRSQPQARDFTFADMVDH